MHNWQAIVLVAGAMGLSCSSHNRVAAAAPAPPRATNWERQIRNAVDAGDGDYQLRTLRQRLAAEPDNLAVRLETAEAYRTRGYPEIALEHYRLAAARFPDSGEAQLGIAKALRSENLRKDAAEGLERFLKTHPKERAELFSWLGILRDEMSLWEAGEAAHRAAIGRSPDSDSLHNNLGYNLLKQGKTEEAAAEFRAALKLSPNSVVARNNLGLALANTGNQEQALKNLQSAADPATAHSNMAAIMIERGKYAEARKELDLALGYNKSHPAALKNLELVSRLDGAPAALPAPGMEPRWMRFKSSVRRLFVGPLEPTPTQKPAANTASLR